MIVNSVVFHDHSINSMFDGVIKIKLTGNGMHENLISAKS
jgi:hypothetical protein